MLDKLKQWTLRVWGAGHQDGGMCREEDLGSTLRSLQECRLDPRELPRPHRHQETCGSVNSTEESGPCFCRNCSHLSSELLECGICLERLEDVTSCVDCGNIACVFCASKLSRCPFCRSELGLQPNKALQRLLCKLDLPCGNSLLPIRCPHKKCKWRGDIVSLSTHLEQVHLLTILNGSAVILNIKDFRRKAEMSNVRQRHYTVLLSCYSDVHICKVQLNHGKLRVALHQLTQPRSTPLAAWVEINCADKTMKGILPLSKHKSDFDVSVSNLITPSDPESDRVSITVSIRPLS